MRVSQLGDKTCASAHQNRVRAPLGRRLNADSEYRSSDCLEAIDLISSYHYYSIKTL